MENMVIDNAFWPGRRVFLTGHTGFKGGWLALWLQQLGAEVHGYSLAPPTIPSLFETAQVAKTLASDVRADIRDYPAFEGALKKANPEIIFHLAAQPLVRASYREPLETLATNVMGTAHLLQAARQVDGLRAIIAITTDKCYENREWVYPYRETDPLGGHDPYSASKGAAELAIASYRKSFLKAGGSGPARALSSARAGNVIGGGDWAEDRIVPDCIRSLVNGKTIRIRNPSAERPWQFVLDPLFGYLLLALAMKKNPKDFSGAWNFGPYHSNNIDVRTLTEKIIREWGAGTWVGTTQDKKLHEASCLRLDITKSVTRLGWRPVYDINQAIRKTVEWYKTDYTRAEDMYIFSLEQIETFIHDAGKSG